MKANIINKKFNYLTVIQEDLSRKGKHLYYLCQCDCGIIKSIRKDDLLTSSTKSCGCKKKELHKLSRTIPTNTEWLLTSSEERDYFIGLLLSDGYISKNGQIGVQLIETDRELLQKLSFFIYNKDNTKLIIKKVEKNYNRKNQYRLVFTNAVFLDYLKSLGFCNNKTINATVPLEFLYNISFWRGVIDGDGCIYTKNDFISLGLIGTENVCNAFKLFVDTIISTKAKPRTTKQYNVPLFNMVISNKNAFTICKILYQDAAICLTRKFKKFSNYAKYI